MDKPEITDALLLDLAGERSFERGEDYYHRGAVEELSIRGGHVTADVQGGEAYVVQLVYNQDGLQGSCDCPASDGVYFCKHCVAAAMVLRDQLCEPETPDKPVRPIALIETFLRQQNKEQLISDLLDLIDSNRQLRHEWLIRAENRLGGMDKATVRKRITAAIPHNQFCYSFSEVRAYFANVEHSLELLAESIDYLPPTDQIELLEYALERIVNTQDSVDDSGGFRYESINLIRQLYLDAFEALDWSDGEKADHLIKLMINDDYNLYGDIPEDYIKVVSPRCIEVFHEKVQSRWDQLPPLETEDWDVIREYKALQRVLEHEASAHNDTATLIWLNQKVARHFRDFLQLAEWSIELEQFDEARSFIEKAAKQKYADDADIHEVKQKLLLKTGKVSDALEAQWQQFQAIPSFANYQSLITIAGQAQSKKDWKAISVDWLKQQLPGKSVFGKQHLSGTLMSIYLADSDTDEAWQLSRNYEFDVSYLKKLATMLAQDVQRASTLYVQMAGHYVNQTNNNSYRQAIALLQEMAELSRSSEHQSNMAKELDRMREEFRFKRNFIKWLNEAFPLQETVQ
ncbi:hypothetical protein NX722_11930 [Endozoicomonas gorgoniicola]|uniref:SWIM-type domain-containing protein n=1 Tax=Endozoicomonas gorgoniicola TaxID=1234144 RepID=A0ABT3MW75_9GAMM|nr:SWIM zinc finger family protein [Endozoicomonas gorgoniicola]MCW7553333.1 hypothetical protein [Endozoicomonas gorgoniicola]